MLSQRKKISEVKQDSRNQLALEKPKMAQGP